MLIAERFDQRTVAHMELALERACRLLPIAADRYEARRHIAGKILECAKHGETTLGGLTEAGCAVATELCSAPRLKRSAGLSSPVNRLHR
jgi:hypothetical protein